MTRRSIFVLAAAILLAASVIATSIFLIVETVSASGGLTMIIIAAGVIVVSLFSVVFIYRIKIRRKTVEKQLNESYYQEFEVIKDAVNNAPLSAGDQKSLLEDVLDLLLAAQTQGKTVQESIGDGQAFAQNILKECISKPRTIAAVICSGLLAFPLFILLTQALLWLENLAQGYFDQRTDLIMVLFFAVISLVLIPTVRLLSIRRSAWPYIIPLASGVVFVGLVELLRALFGSSDHVIVFLDQTVNMVPDLIALIVYLAAILILFTLRIMIRPRPLF